MSIRNVIVLFMLSMVSIDSILCLASKGPSRQSRRLSQAKEGGAKKRVVKRRTSSNHTCTVPGCKRVEIYASKDMLTRHMIRRHFELYLTSLGVIPTSSEFHCLYFGCKRTKVYKKIEDLQRHYLTNHFSKKS